MVVKSKTGSMTLSLARDVSTTDGAGDSIALRIIGRMSEKKNYSG